MPLAAGVQIATNIIDEGVRAGLLAAEAGASFVDLNCGCPIHEASRRGLGSILLRRPAKLARLVQGIAERLPIPLTVKIRLGDNKINAQEVRRAGPEGPRSVASAAAAARRHCCPPPPPFAAAPSGGGWHGIPEVSRNTARWAHVSVSTSTSLRFLPGP